MKSKGRNTVPAGPISLLLPVVLCLTTRWTPTALCQTLEVEDITRAITPERHEKCQPVSDHSCQNSLPYNYTYDSLDITAVIEEMGLSLNCSEDLIFLICAWKQPRCEPEAENAITGPCKELCERTVAGCGSKLREIVNSEEWSGGMGCSELPREETAQEGLCVAIYNESEFQETNVPTPLTLPDEEIYMEDIIGTPTTSFETVSAMIQTSGSSADEQSEYVQGATITQTDTLTKAEHHQLTTAIIFTANVSERRDEATLLPTTQEVSTETSHPKPSSKIMTTTSTLTSLLARSEYTTVEDRSEDGPEVRPEMITSDLTPTAMLSFETGSETLESSSRMTTLVGSTIVTSVLPSRDQASPSARTTFIPLPPSPPPPSPFSSRLTDGITGVENTGANGTVTSPEAPINATLSTLNGSTTNLDTSTEPFIISTKGSPDGESTTAFSLNKETTESIAKSTGTLDGGLTSLLGVTLFNVTATVSETTENSFIYTSWRMTLNGDCKYAEEQNRSFTQSFVKTLSAMLYLRQEQVKIDSIKCGSVVVEFTLEFRSGKDDKQMEKAENELIRISVTEAFIVEVNGRIYAVNDVIQLSSQPPEVKPTDPTEPPSGGMSFEEQQFIIYLVLGCVLAVILFIAILVCVQKYCKHCCVKKARAPPFPDEHCGVRLADFNMTNQMIPRAKSIYADTLSKNGKLKPYMTDEEIEQAVVPYFYANEALVNSFPEKLPDPNSSLISAEMGLFRNGIGTPEWHGSNYADTLNTNSVMEESRSTLNMDEIPPPPPNEPPPEPPYPLPDELCMHIGRETGTSTPSTADTNWLLAGVDTSSHSSGRGLDNQEFVTDAHS